MIKDLFINTNQIKFQHDMAYGDFKDLLRRTVPERMLRDKAFNTFTAKEFSETRTFMHLSKHVFGSQ